MKAKKFVISTLAVMVGASVCLAGCGIDKDATLIDVNNGEAKITLGYGNFAARYQQAMYDQFLGSMYGKDMWTRDMSGQGSTFEDETKTGILNDIEEQYLCKAHAADYQVALSDEDNKAISEAVDKFYQDNSKETLEVMGATKELVKEYLENRTIVSRVQSAIKEEANIQVSDDECWQRSFSYVLFSTASTTDDAGNEIPASDADIKEQKEAAKALSEAEDFDAAAEESELSVATYSYTKGESEDSSFDMAVIKSAEKLKEGEVSSVIEVEGTGYYVIRLDADHDAEASESKRDSIKSTKENEYYDEVLTGWQDATTFTVDEKQWSKVKFDTLFKAIETEETDESEAGAAE